MNKNKQTEPVQTVAALPGPQTKRYADAFKQAAAENRALKSELARVREQRDILKKTLAGC